MDYITQIRATIRHFTLEEDGVFLVLSEDSVFLNVLNNALLKDLALPRKYVQIHTRPDKLLNDIATRHKAKQKPFVIIERIVNKRLLDQFIGQVKSNSPNIKILLLSGEIKRDTLALLFELGVDNVIIKPLSANTFIEKVANTIKPNAQLGQLIEEGKAQLHNGFVDEAIAIAEQILSVKPDSAAGHMLMGDSLKRQGKGSEAVLQYEAAMDTSGLYLGPIQRLADHYIEINQPEKALHYMDKLDTLSPLNYERKIDIGEVNLKLGNEDRANEVIGEAVRIAKQDDARLLGEVANKLANTCMKINPMVCESHLKDMLDGDAKTTPAALIEVWNRLGIALRRQGKWEEAVEEYNKAIMRMPDDENLYFNKALALAEGKQFADAARTLDTVTTMNDGFGRRDPNLSSTMGRIYHMANRPDDALLRYQDTLFFQPENREVQGWLDEIEQQPAKTAYTSS